MQPKGRRFMGVEIRRVARGLARRPGFALATIIVLALGIGANTAIYSVVSAVLLRPLPFAEPDRLVVVHEANAARGLEARMAPPTYLDWRGAQSSLQGLAAFGEGRHDLRVGGEPRRLSSAAISANFFEVLGVRPALGRSFRRSEDRPGAAPRVILSHALWQGRFGGDPAVVGEIIPLDDDEGYLVVGVAPPGFEYPPGTDLWTPLQPAIPEALTIRGARFLVGLGRLAPGVSRERAEAELTAIARGIPELEGWGARLIPLHEQVTGNVRPALLILLAAVGFVLLVACANVANLILARTAERRRELAIRSALGAGRLRIAGSLLTESVLLALAGGLVAVLAALWGLDLLLAVSPEQLPRADEIAVNGGVLAFTLGLALVTGLAAGMVPAWRFSRPDLVGELKEGGGSVAGGVGVVRLRGALVIGEVALSLLLLTGAGLMAKSLLSITAVDPGLRPDGVMTFELFLPDYRYEGPDDYRAFMSELDGRVEAIPGVRSAALARNLPFGGSSMTSPVTLESAPETEDRTAVQAIAVSPGYFEALGIDVIRGRAFQAADGPGNPPVAMVNEAFVRHFFGGRDAVGERATTWFGPRVMREIVGVVEDVHHSGLTAAAPPALYTPMAQDPKPNFTLIAQAADGTADVVAPVRAAIHEVDPALPIPRVVGMDELLARSVAQPRFYAVMLALFAAMALGMALAGFYAVMANNVAQRRREIGVRMALGARGSDVARLVVGRGLTLTGLGVGVGLLGAAVLTRLLESILFRVSAWDPTVFVAVPLMLFAVAGLASYLPARAAASTDPTKTLRD